MNRLLLSLIGVMLAMITMPAMAEDTLESRPFEVFKARPAPDLTIENPEGEAVPVGGFTGEVVIMNVWATWCPPCVRELPALQQLQREFQHKGLKVITVSADADGFAAALPFLEEMRITLPAYIDRDGALYRALEIRGLPTTFILNRQGEFIARIEGDLNWLSGDTLTYINALLGGH